MTLTVPPSDTPRTVKKEFTIAAERNERLKQLAEMHRISENELVERALDLYFGLSYFFEAKTELADRSHLAEAALRRVWDNEQDIVQTYPHLWYGQVYVAMAYYHEHQAYIDDELAELDAEYERLRSQYQDRA